MDGSALQHQLAFYLPPCGLSTIEALRFPPELLKIFYIARVIFSDTSTHRIKSQASPLFARKHIFTGRPEKSAPESPVHRKALMDNFINLGKIQALHDIARLLPREHVLYSDTIFYKKLANRELIKIDYEGAAEGILSVDTFLKQQETELTRSQKIYLLFDNSTSMNGERFKKLFVAKAIAIEYLRRVAEESPQIYFRSFHSDIGELIKASSRESIHRVIQYITQLQTGGGRITNIGDAVVQAIQDITSDPEMEEAEIVVLTDGFGPIPKNLKELLGQIKLHIILIPDLDIEKILALYPNRAAWEEGGTDGSRPMPEFWKYYSNDPPPRFLHGDEMYQKTYRSYQTAKKSVKEQKALEILQGLNQIYTLQEVCENFIFVIISSILGEEFPFSPQDVAAFEDYITDLEAQDISHLTNEEKLRLLQSITFVSQLLTVARDNTRDKAVLAGIKRLTHRLDALLARLLEDPWLRTILKVDRISIRLSFDLAGARKNDRLSFFEALAYLVRFFITTLREALKQLWYDYKI
ncbi:MAG: VWA domain-containing protein [Desulfobacterota bacterium]|nr:VWA domain-containing protein [Thermodesulfobacteriota bacterium]